MSTKKTENGTHRSSETDALQTVTQTLRRITGDGERVTLTQLARETGLSRADAEQAMGSVERVAPLSAKRVVEPGAAVAWEISL